MPVHILSEDILITEEKEGKSWKDDLDKEAVELVTRSIQVTQLRE